MLFPKKITHQNSAVSNVSDKAEQAAGSIDNSSLEIPVLMYHYIRLLSDKSDEMGANLSVTPEAFNHQLSYLENNGYETIDFDRALRLFANEEKIEKKPVILTFDDGYNDAYLSAMPLLKAHGQIGVFYIISAFIMRDGFLSFDDVSGLIENKMVIGCHTLDHQDLTRLPLDKVRSELVDCKESLKNVYSVPVSDFSYPSGKYDNAVKNAVQEAGFKTATTTKSGIWKQSDDPYLIPRIRMTETTDLSKILK